MYRIMLIFLFRLDLFLLWLNHIDMDPLLPWPQESIKISAGFFMFLPGRAVPNEMVRNIWVWINTYT